MNHSIASDSRQASVDHSLARWVESLTERLQAGESIDRAALAREHPEFAGQLEQLWPVLQALANLSNSLGRLPQGHGAEPHPAAEEWGTLGDYAIHREVGRGGMGVVYEATQISLGRRVALKVLPFAATMDKRQLQRFHNEARAAASLEHANIVPVYGVGTERGVHYYAMRFIEGQSLEAMLQEMRQTSEVLKTSEVCSPQTRAQASTLKSTKRSRDHWRCIAELAIQAAEALEHAHQSGVIHRDVKPANLLLDEEGKLWITDFGLAQIQSDTRLTITGDLVGTLRYMSPEQALAKRVILDHRTDIYSLGATIYEVMTLKPVFAGQDRQELLRQIAFEEPVAPRRLERTIPVELETVILKALEKNSVERYSTAKEMAEDLKRFLKDEPTRARRPTLWLRGRKWARRHVAAVRAGAVAVLVVLFVLAGMAGWWLSDRKLRETAADQVASAALQDAERLQNERRIPEAFSAAKRADAALAAATGTVALKQRVEARLADLKMANDLEEIRAQTATQILQFMWDTGEILMNYTVIDQRYSQVFTAYGLDVNGLAPDALGQRIRVGSVAVEIAAALDDWSGVARVTRAADNLFWKHLLAVARAADPDRWRNKLREALANDNADALKLLLTKAPIEELSPTTVKAFVDVLDSAGSKDEAVHLLREAQWCNSGDYWINYELSRLLARRLPPEDDEALCFATVARALRPESALAQNNLGARLSKKGRLDDAIAAYREAVRLKPDFEVAHSNLRDLLINTGKLDEAIDNCRRAIARNRSDLGAYRTLAGVHFFRGELVLAHHAFMDAIAACRESLNKANFAVYHNNLARLLSDCPDITLREPKAALASASKAVALAPKNAESRQVLGAAYYRNHEWEKALEALDQAIKLRKPWEGIEAFYLRAMVHAQLEEWERAGDWYDKAEILIKQGQGNRAEWHLVKP